MDQEQVQAPNVVVTNHMLNSLRATKPWTLFLSIIGFASMGIMVLAGLIMMVASQFFPRQAHPYFMTTVSLFYIVLGLLYLIPMRYLYKYSSAVGRFLSVKEASEMESALAYQKSFWKFMGILCLVMIILAILGFIAAVVIGFMVGSKA